MKASYDAIYLSPHLDDAVLSCGGQIFQRTESDQAVLIVSVMAGDAPPADLSEFAQNLHDRWQLSDDAVARRRREDAAACAKLGADFLHLDIMDCIYRRHPESGEGLYASEDALFGTLHPAESKLAQSLARTLAKLPNGDHVLAPLSVGHHVDHQLTRLAAELWMGRHRLGYYEDFPYVLTADMPPVALSPADRWRSQLITLSEKALAMRIEAIACYQSQLSTFFRDHDDLVRTVSGYVRAIGGERIWRHIALKANCDNRSLPI